MCLGDWPGIFRIQETSDSSTAAEISTSRCAVHVAEDILPIYHAAEAYDNLDYAPHL